MREKDIKTRSSPSPPRPCDVASFCSVLSVPASSGQTSLISCLPPAHPGISPLSTATRRGKKNKKSSNMCLLCSCICKVKNDLSFPHQVVILLHVANNFGEACGILIFLQFGIHSKKRLMSPMSHSL